MYLATLEDMFALMGTDFDPTDLRAIQAIEGASGMVRTYTGREFSYTEADEVVLDGTGTYQLLLPETPVLAIDTVETWDNDDVATAVTTYRFKAEAGIVVRLDAVWPLGAQNIHVTYDHGYVMPGDVTDPTIPDDLRATTAQIAARLYGLIGGQTAESETIGSYSYKLSSGAATSGLTELETLVLSRYRTPSLA